MSATRNAGVQVSYSIAARRTGLSDSGAGLAELARGRGIEVPGTSVDMSLFAGESVSLSWGALTVLETGAL